MWVGTGSLPAGIARCLTCRRANPKRKPPAKPKGAAAPSSTCPDCGTPCWGKRCKPCASKAQTVRAEGDHRLVRKHRERSAPGLTTTERARLMARWKKQRKACVYCGELATTVDHVVPLVRGGTNYEGNLAPCCRSCNGSKSGYLIAEWRTGRRLPRMTKAPEWKRSRKPKPIKAIKGEQAAFNVCPECGSLCVNTYCNSTCGSRYAMRRNYRLKVGVPLDAPLYRSDKPQWRRTWVA